MKESEIGRKGERAAKRERYREMKGRNERTERGRERQRWTEKGGTNQPPRGLSSAPVQATDRQCMRPLCGGRRGWKRGRGWRTAATHRQLSDGNCCCARAHASLQEYERSNYHPRLAISEESSLAVISPSPTRGGTPTFPYLLRDPFTSGSRASRVGSIVTINTTVDSARFYVIVRSVCSANNSNLC